MAIALGHGLGSYIAFGPWPWHSAMAFGHGLVAIGPVLGFGSLFVYASIPMHDGISPHDNPCNRKWMQPKQMEIAIQKLEACDVAKRAFELDCDGVPLFTGSA